MYLNNPEFAKIGDKKYKINTDFRIALECNDIAQDETINDYERSLAIIYKLFGDEGLKNNKDYEKLIEIAIKYLKCGSEEDDEINDKPNMDYKQDYRLIQASFKSDYGIILEEEKMHYWDFNAYLNGLTDKCILSRIRELRDYDLTQIKDINERNKIKKMQNKWSLKKKQKHYTKEENDNINNFYNQLGIKKGE